MATVIDASSLWQSVLGDLQVRINRPSYDTWLSDTHGLRHGNGQLIVETPNSFVCSMLEKRMYSMIAESVERVFGEPLEIIFKIASLENSVAADEGPSHIPEIIPDNKVTVSASPSNNGIIRRYTFDSFILGKSYELAYAASQAVSSNPGNTYNPLFIYAKVGLGKTHLLHAIGNELLSVGKNIHYTTTEEFTNEYIDAIRNGKTENFRNRYRHVDTLLLDDIQFLIGKNATQEEFLNTIDELSARGCRVFLAGDRSIQSMPFANEALLTRLMAGISCPIDNPDLDTRLAILKSKAAQAKMVLSEEVLRYVAERFHESVRQLEGVIHRLRAHYELLDASLDIDRVRQILTDLVRLEKRPVRLPQVEQAVCEVFGLSPKVLRSNMRQRSVSQPRMMAMYLARKHTQAAYREIGEYFGGRNHSTVISAEKKVSGWVEQSGQSKVDRSLLTIQDALVAVEHQLRVG